METDEPTAVPDPPGWPESDTPTPVIEPLAAADSDTDTTVAATTPIAADTVHVTPGSVGRRVPLPVAAVVAAVGIALTGGLAAWGASGNGTLDSTRTNLSSVQSELETTKTIHATTKTALESTKDEVTEATAERKAQEAEVSELSLQVASETMCITRQEATLDELRRISDLETDNFNRTAEKSAWYKAEVARGKAIDAALDAYYKAYRAAWDSRTAAARAAVDDGKAAERRIAEQEKKQKDELATVDKAADGIAAAIEALEAKLLETAKTCEEVAR